MQTARLPSRKCCLAAFLFVYLSLIISHSYGDDTLYGNQSLSGDKTLVSEGENFELGFFRPGNSSKYYIGMWYKKVALRTIVWVANREVAISDRYSSELKVVDGNLVLYNESRVPIWSTNVRSLTTSRSSVVAVLLDDGNLVLRDGLNASRPLWQSFDCLADTWLPGSKISFDYGTGTNHPLTSWTNAEDPSPGLFSLELDPAESKFLIRWNGSVEYWTSGSYNGTVFSLVPEMMFNRMYNFTYITTSNESYFTYSLYDPSLISRFIMDVSGQFKQLTWSENTNKWDPHWTQPRQQCEVYGFCGPFGTCNQNPLPFCNCLTGFKPRYENEWKVGDFGGGGCVRRTILQCGNVSRVGEEKQGFLMSSSVGLPQNSYSLDVRSEADCRSACLNNCSCTAYSYDNRGCSIWNDELLNLTQHSSRNGNWRTVYVKLAASDIPTEKSKIKSSGIIISIVIFVVILSCSIAYVYYRRVTRISGNRDNSVLYANESTRLATSSMDMGELGENAKEGMDAPFFDFKIISAATDDFSYTNKLGEGGFGPVYKGKLAGGREIAVKRLSIHSGQGLEEFKTEVVLIAKLQHRNLVKILGYCIQGEEKIVIYEHMPNKSLDSFIFDQTRSKLLDWANRFDIILGIARGLLYLHQDSRLRIIHRDMKTSNILLDAEMNPKISDFGLARIVGGRVTEACTRRVAGTYGYMSPEYASHGHFSTKSDVFSFGVVVLEIISGKKTTGSYHSNQALFHHSEQALSLLGYAWNLWKEEKSLDLMDHTLHESLDLSEALKCLIVGLLCVQEDPNDRPSMTNVVWMLGSDTADLPNPKQPAFVRREQFQYSHSSSEQKTQYSNNGLTVSILQGR